MKDNTQRLNQINNNSRTQNVSKNTSVSNVHRTYKPRTPITKTTIAIMNDPFVFNC